MDTSLQDLIGLNIHGRALQSTSEQGGPYQFYDGEDGYVSEEDKFGLVELIGMIIGFTATAIFVVFTMIMICIDDKSRKKDYVDAIAQDKKTMDELEFTEEEVKALYDKFLKQEKMNLDELKEQEEAEQMAAMN